MTAADAAPGPGAAIPLASLPNLRDLGGWSTVDGGTVRHGQVFRSMELGYLADADLPGFEALAIRTVYDLRTAAERAASPDRGVDGVREVALDVLADDDDTAAATLPQAMANPDAVRRLLGDGRGQAMLADSYRKMVTLPSARAAYGTLLRDLAATTGRPALFHCTAGKDRTGWAAAVLLMLLGVPAEDVRADYLRTNDQFVPALQPLLDSMAANGIDPDLLRPVLGVQEEYLDTALTEVDAVFGSFDAYLHAGLGVDDATRAALHRVLVAPAGGQGRGVAGTTS